MRHCLEDIYLSKLFLLGSIIVLTNCKDSLNSIALGAPEVFIADEYALEFPGLGHRQSMAFYGGKAIFVNGQMCDIYSLSSFEKDAHIDLPCDEYGVPHSNVTCISSKFFSSDSAFPAIYVSSWDKGRQAFVYDIMQKNKSYEASLIQVIDPFYVSERIIGSGYLDWVVDSEGYLYSVAYHLKGTSMVSNNNYTHVVKFALPSLQEKRVYLDDSDVLDSFFVPVMTVFQDKFYLDGHIYIVAGIPDNLGLYPPRLFDIDIKTKQLSETLIPLSGEPEGFCFYQGQKWLNLYGSDTVYNLDKLLHN